jgi:hypothetical protein
LGVLPSDECQEEKKDENINETVRTLLIKITLADGSFRDNKDKMNSL